MKQTFGCAILIVSLLGLTSPAFGQQAKIEGQVYDHKDKPVAAVKIVVMPGGQAGTTDSKGHFIISLPNHIRPGQAARIRVQKINWVVRSPLFGECATQSTERHMEPLRVVIVPRGSPALFTPKVLDEFVLGLRRQIMRLTDMAATQNHKLTTLERQFAKYAFIEEYSREYGLPVDTLKASLDEWSRVRKSDDKLQRALKEYVNGNLEVVTELTEDAGPGYVRQLELDNERRLESSRNVIKNYTLGGSAFYEQLKFREALNVFTTLEQLFDSKKISKEDFANDWAELKLLIAGSKMRLSLTVAGAEGPRLLNEALDDAQAVATVFIREQSPEDWARLQYSRANAMHYLGQRTFGARGIEYLKRAEADSRAVLEVKTRERSPQQWVWTQNKLANVLHTLGERSEGIESVQYLKMAEEMYRAALEVTNFKSWPQDGAIAQHNLGVTLRELGLRAAGAEGRQYLRNAVNAHRAALTLKTRELWPEDWALAQDGLGNALCELGRRTAGSEGIALLKEAMVAQRAALEVRTREDFPQWWATTKGSLAKTFYHLAERTTGEESLELLNESANGNRAALEIFTRDVWVEDWAQAQNNLAASLIGLGLRTQGAAAHNHLREAEAVIRATLQVLTREASPQSWAMTQNNQGLMLTLLVLRTGGRDSANHLRRAVTSFHAALEVFTRVGFPQLWALSQNNLGNAFRVLGQLVHGTAEGSKYLKEAEAAHRRAFEVYTRGDFPQQWANTHVNLGSTHFLLGDLARASESYINALETAPDNAEAYRGAIYVNHELLFRFEQTFDLHRRWLTRHENNVAVQADFAEAHFTTGRFAESRQRIAALLARPESPALPASSRVALRAIEIAGMLALGQEGEVAGQLAALVTEVSRQPATFRLDWSFNGTKHFIQHSEKLVTHRKWLENLLAALASEDRDKMLMALRAL